MPEQRAQFGAELCTFDSYECLTQPQPVRVVTKLITSLSARACCGDRTAHEGLAALRRKTPPATAGFGKFGLAGWAPIRLVPFRISAPAGRSGQARRPSSHWLILIHAAHSYAGAYVINFGRSKGFGAFVAMASRLRSWKGPSCTLATRCRSRVLE